MSKKRITLSQQVELGELKKVGNLVKLPRSTILTAGEHNGIIFLEEEIQKIEFPKAFPLTLDHSRSVADEVGWWEAPAVENGKLRAVPVINLETAKGEVALGYVKNRMAAGLTPEVSVEVWIDAETKGGKIYARNITLDKASLVDRGACGPEKGCGIGLQKEMVEMGVVPEHPWNYGKDAESSWGRPNLSDFTDKPWDELTDAEKKSITGHFAWAPKNPPDRFTDLKLPHHDPKSHDVVWNGVRAAMAALLGARGGVNVPSSDKPKIYSHLAAHYKEFGKVPPEVKFNDAGDPIAVEWQEGEDKVEFGNIEPDTTEQIAEPENTIPDEPEKMSEAPSGEVKPVEEQTPDYKALYEEAQAEIGKLKAELERLRNDYESILAKLKAYEDAERETLIKELKELNPDFNPEGKTLDQLRELYDFAKDLKVGLAKRKSFVVSEPEPSGEEDYFMKLRKKMKELERRE